MLDQMRRAPLHKYGNVTILAWGNEITTFRIETLCVPDPARVYRVAQWATGRIGTAALRELIRSPQFELVGVYVHSAEKDGQDAGHCAACRRPGRRRRGISQPSGGDVGVDISGGSYTGFSGSTKYSGLRRHAVRRRLSAEPSRRADYRQQHRRGDYRQRPHCRVQRLHHPPRWRHAVAIRHRRPMPLSHAGIDCLRHSPVHCVEHREQFAGGFGRFTRQPKILQIPHLETGPYANTHDGQRQMPCNRPDIRAQLTGYPSVTQRSAAINLRGKFQGDQKIEL